MARIVLVLSRLRFTILFVIAMLVANVLAGTFNGDLPAEALKVWGIGQESVWKGDLARLLTGIFLSHDIEMLARQFVFAASVIGFTEWNLGSWRTALLFFALDIAATLILLLAVWKVPALAGVTELNDVGMSMGGFALIGIMIARLRFRWLLSVLVLLGIAGKIAIDFEPLTDTGHLLALCLGIAVGLVLVRPAGRT